MLFASPDYCTCDIIIRTHLQLVHIKDVLTSVIFNQFYLTILSIKSFKNQKVISSPERSLEDIRVNMNTSQN